MENYSGNAVFEGFCLTWTLLKMDSGLAWSLVAPSWNNLSFYYFCPSNLLLKQVLMRNSQIILIYFIKLKEPEEYQYTWVSESHILMSKLWILNVIILHPQSDYSKGKVEKNFIELFILILPKYLTQPKKVF